MSLAKLLKTKGPSRFSFDGNVALRTVKIKIRQTARLSLSKPSDANSLTARAKNFNFGPSLILPLFSPELVALMVETFTYPRLSLRKPFQKNMFRLVTNVSTLLTSLGFQDDWTLQRLVSSFKVSF